MAADDALALHLLCLLDVVSVAGCQQLLLQHNARREFQVKPFEDLRPPGVVEQVEDQHKQTRGVPSTARPVLHPERARRRELPLQSQAEQPRSLSMWRGGLTGRSKSCLTPW